MVRSGKYVLFISHSHSVGVHFSNIIVSVIEFIVKDPEVVLAVHVVIVVADLDLVRLVIKFINQRKTFSVNIYFHCGNIFFL